MFAKKKYTETKSARAGKPNTEKHVAKRKRGKICVQSEKVDDVVLDEEGGQTKQAGRRACVASVESELKAQDVAN